MAQSPRLILAALAALAIGAPTVARADIITALDGSPVAVGSNYAYTYNVSLSGGQLDAVSDGTPLQFGTVYDFGPVVGSITTTGILSQFTFSLANTNTPASQTMPYDDPTLNNIRFTYVGTTDYAVTGQPTTNADATFLPSAEDNLGTFTVISPFGPTLATAIQYDGTSYKGQNDTPQGNVGYTSGPVVPPTQVPEPASLLLFGAGLAGIGLLRRRV